MSRLALAFALSLALLPTFAAAQATPSAATRAQARTAFRAGERDFAEQRFEAALEEFRRAFRLAPHDAVRFNVAVCLERLARLVEAAQEYDAAAVSTELDEATRRRAREQAARVRLGVGTIVADGSPAGADLLVDGERRCALPCRIEVDPGRRVVSVRQGTREDHQTVTVEAGAEARVHLAASQPVVLPVRHTRVSRGGRSGPSERHEHHETVPRRGGHHVGVLTFAGAGVAALGAAGVIGFGLHAQSLHDDYVRTGSEQTRSDGETARNLSNVSLAVAIAGAVAVGIDLVLVATSGGSDDEERPVSVTPTGVTVRF